MDAKAVVVELNWMTEAIPFHLQFQNMERPYYFCNDEFEIVSLLYVSNLTHQICN